MKRVFLCVLWAVTLEAQSISITNPSSGAAVSGYSGFQFQVSLTSAPSVARVCYTVDFYAAYNPGIDAATTLGCSITPPFSYSYNSYWNLNGPHQVVATAYNALGAVIATSAPVSFNTANTWPISCNPAMTLTPGTAFTSNWSGTVSLQATITGSCASDNKAFHWYVDGILQGSLNGTAASQTWSIDTRQFPNGARNVCVTSNDTTNASVYSDGTINGATESCNAVIFANGTAPSQTVANAHDVYLPLGNTFTFVAQTLNTDGTVVAPSAAAVYVSSNMAVATVGQSSGVVTPVATGNSTIYAMAPSVAAGTGLASVGPVSNAQVTNSSNPFTPTMAGWLLQVTGGTNAIPGVYLIHDVGSGTASLRDPLNPSNSKPAFTSGSSNGTFTMGPTRDEWVFVPPGANTMPCFAANGVIHTSYSTNCIIPHSLFSGVSVFNDQPYTPGAAADFAASGWWSFEAGAIPNPLATQTAGGMSAWQSAQSAYVAGYEANVASFPTLSIVPAGENFTYGSDQLWGVTNGPAGQWSTPALTYAMQSWNAYNTPFFINGDEINFSWAGQPLQGPITYGITSQSWLSQIVASGGTCTATTSPNTVINGASTFIIRGSTIAGMNSAYQTEYHASSPNTSSFNFACTGVANGTYNASNDPGLILEPYASSNSAGVNGWYTTNTTGPNFGFIDSSAFAQIRKQFVAARVNFGMAFPNAGLTSCASIGNWGSNGMQNNGGVTNLADFNSIYPPNTTVPSFLTSRYQLSALVAPGNIGGTIRSVYGCFPPNLPIVALTDSTATAGYGIGYGPRVSVASTSGNTITFSSPHGITNIIPGISRLFITGATNTGSPQDSTNNNFYILSVPNATTVTVALAAPDFAGSGTGGTMTFSDSNTASLNTIAASANGCGNSYTNNAVGGSLCGALFTTPAASSALPRERGRTFTLSGVSGTGSTNFNAGTFQLLAENLRITPSASTTFYWRQIPSLSATGGTATIILDNNNVKGRNPSSDSVGGQAGDLTPDYAFGTVIECIFLRCSGDRLYQYQAAGSGYSDQSGFINQTNANTQIPIFADTASQSSGQHYANQHWENGASVPLHKVHVMGNLIWNRLAKYWLQPRLNSPDYGFLIDCGAASGSYGEVLGCLNVSDGVQTETFSLSTYETSGQNIIRYVVNDHSISAVTIIAAGTATDTLTLQPGDVVFYVFPATFSSELQQPAISARLADVTNATALEVQWAYDPYYLTVAGNSYNCGAGACTPPWDRNIGTLYYRLIYLGPSSVVLATSDVQTL